MKEFIVRFKWVCDTIYRKVNSESHCDLIHSIEKKYKLKEAESSESASKPEYNRYSYTAMNESYGYVEIEIVEFKNKEIKEE